MRGGRPKGGEVIGKGRANGHVEGTNEVMRIEDE